MLEDLLEVVLIRVLWPQGAHELFGHGFGGYARCHHAASSHEGRSRSRANNPEGFTCS